MTTDEARKIQSVLGEGRVGFAFRDVLSSGGYGPEMVVLPRGRLRRVPTLAGRDCPIDVPAFSIARHCVTFDEYDHFCDVTGHRRAKDEGWGRGDRPVIHVSWWDAVAYVAWLSAQTGARYRLPRGPEWEFAATVGGKLALPLAEAAHCRGGASAAPLGTLPVGSLPPNEWGLHDMAGNVMEWLEDGAEPARLLSRPATWPFEGSRGLRGGSWERNLEGCAFNKPYREPPGYRDREIGFRVARPLWPLPM